MSASFLFLGDESRSQGLRCRAIPFTKSPAVNLSEKHLASHYTGCMDINKLHSRDVT